MCVRPYMCVSVCGVCVCVCRGGTHLVRAAVGILAGGREREKERDRGRRERERDGRRRKGGPVCAVTGTRRVQIEKSERKMQGERKRDTIFRGTVA